MKNITAHLWFDREAIEAAGLYTSIFKNSRIKSTSRLENTPSGSVDLVTVDLMGRPFTLISAGPLFKFNPSISFLVACTTKDEVDSLWKKLGAGGSVLMELGTYPFSERYGWLQDRYGLSWQVMLMGAKLGSEGIIPTLMFVGNVCGKAEEAVRFYASVFSNAKVGDILRYGKGALPDREGTIQHVSFTLEGLSFAAMDSAYPHKFAFNEAISFMRHCDTQEEIDHYWQALSADPKAEQCGWLKDRYGLSWQIVPTAMGEMMNAKDPKKLARVTEAFLKMKKFDIATLQKAFDSPS